MVKGYPIVDNALLTFKLVVTGLSSSSDKR